MDTYMGRGKDDIENLVSSLIFLENEILYGDSFSMRMPRVGKSCLLLRFSDGSFTTSFITTIGIDFKIRTVELDGKRIKLLGHSWSRTIPHHYNRGAMGILLVYDVTDESSFNNIRNWIRNIEQHASDNVNKILVGNKADMDESKRVVPTAKGQALADEYGIKFFETIVPTSYKTKKVKKEPKKSERKVMVEYSNCNVLIRKKVESRMTILLATFYVVHSVWAVAEAYSAPSIVLTSHSPEGLHVFDDFREAYAWLSHNTHVDDKVSNPLTS
ncbi:hypothetical protein L2E82_10846 [Cichorium intybus]|uniref:Uncharacterized protein n=1 Tax=Cichorium intybus TaxID=13427 RepID=A0ACB9GCD3_CICIN|nr:hypothetical protein L2E82_10846 [Cichorium intybus]